MKYKWTRNIYYSSGKTNKSNYEKISILKSLKQIQIQQFYVVVNETEVMDQISCLNINDAYWLDNISPVLIKKLQISFA